MPAVICRFEFCYGRYVQQYHDDKRTGRTTITVGTWSDKDHNEWASNDRNRAVVYEQGTVRWSIFLRVSSENEAVNYLKKIKSSKNMKLIKQHQQCGKENVTGSS